ncbi:MAG: bifunctional adenosylcobinamide kinase/adenosylcobinamide-phosphate guanylyltransferase [Oscillospiraceae bacterium]
MASHPPGGDFRAAFGAEPRVIILCDEVGCGVVPIAPEERAYRETVGRLCCRLAEQAVGVERVFCGLAMCLKGETIWN